MMGRAQWELPARLCRSRASPPAPAGVLTSVANFIPLSSLEVQGEQRLQEQGMFWEGHFGALCEGNLCTGGE